MALIYPVLKPIFIPCKYQKINFEGNTQSLGSSINPESRSAREAWLRIHPVGLQLERESREKINLGQESWKNFYGETLRRKLVALYPTQGEFYIYIGSTRCDLISIFAGFL